MVAKSTIEKVYVGKTIVFGNMQAMAPLANGYIAADVAERGDVFLHQQSVKFGRNIDSVSVNKGDKFGKITQQLKNQMQLEISAKGLNHKALAIITGMKKTSYLSTKHKPTFYKGAYGTIASDKIDLADLLTSAGGAFADVDLYDFGTSEYALMLQTRNSDGTRGAIYKEVAATPAVGEFAITDLNTIAFNTAENGSLVYFDFIYDDVTNGGVRYRDDYDSDLPVLDFVIAVKEVNSVSALFTTDKTTSTSWETGGFKVLHLTSCALIGTANRSMTNPDFEEQTFTFVVNGTVTEMVTIQ